MNTLPNDQLLSFTKGFKSVILSTVNPSSEPLGSYAPCVFLDHEIYIIISEAAPHFHNMKANPKVSALLLEDESSAQSIFFRKRLSMTCEATFVDPKTMHQVFKETHGDLVDMLLNQLDFSIVKLQVISGTFVIGAGQAYKMDGAFKLLEQDRGAKERGHSK
jgi:putative heme iron utilization protein